MAVNIDFIHCIHFGDDVCKVKDIVSCHYSVTSCCGITDSRNDLREEYVL